MLPLLKSYRKKDFSMLSLIGQGLRHNQNWKAHWRTPSPKKRYKIVIIGGGGHGLATAYYLGKECGITDVAVIEKGWIGGGNSGRNTTIVRSVYTQEESLAIYNHSVRLYQTLGHELNYNIMYSPRGVLQLGHSHHELQGLRRRGSLAKLKGIPVEFLTPTQIKAMIPEIEIHGRFPILGGWFQSSAGVARHDAIVWGFARKVDSMGIDILQNCEVTGINVRNGAVHGVQTTRGAIGAERVAVVAAAHSTTIAQMAGVSLPIQTYPLQAFVSEPIKPVLNTVVMSPEVHVYVSQSDKGELVVGAGTDSFRSFYQRGSFDMMDEITSALTALFPFVSRLRMLRKWGGAVDMTSDRSPILSKSPVKGLYFNCGWGTGGFKAIPGSGHVFAHSLASEDMHKFAAPFTIDRLYSGALIEEGAASGVAH